MKRLKHIAMVAVIGLAMLAQLMSPTLAYADGKTTPPPVETLTETPTPAPTETPTETPTESLTPEASPTDMAATEPMEAIPTEVAATEVLSADPAFVTPEPVETSVPEVATEEPEATPEPTEPADSKSESSGTALVETTTTEAATETEQPPLSETMQALPEDTSVVVLDEGGEVLPLASQETSDVIAQADPIWCPEGVSPVPFTNGCTGSYSTMEELLTLEGGYINSQITGGTIWITEGIVPDVNSVVIDGTTYTNWANFTLGMQGGWSGLYGDTSIYSNSQFSVPITIANWNNNVYMGNIAAPSVNINDTNGVVILANVDSEDTNIKNQKGRIDVYNSRGNLTIDSANINNGGIFSSGINVHTFTGNLTINNSIFWGNGYAGAWMENVGNITINNSAAHSNAYDGVWLNNAGIVGIDGSEFYQNANNGITIQNAQSVAVSNSSFGITEIDVAGTPTLMPANASMGMTISALYDVNFNNSNFKGNGYAGLDATSYYGNVTLNQLTADGNYGTGLNAYAAGSINANDIKSSNNINGGGGCPLSCGNGIFLNGTNGVQLSGVNTFTNNGWTGVDALSYGDITLNNVTATGNQGFGSYLVSYGGSTTLSGTNTFSSNGADGVLISSASNVNVNGPISLDGNSWSGLEIWSSGDITLNDITATGNLASGTYLSAGGTISLHGANEFSNNAYTGLFASSYGPVTLNNLTAGGNGGNGVLIYSNGSVSATGTNSFFNNGWTALEIWSSSDITLNDVTATDNYQWGSYLIGAGNITLNGAHDYSRNAAGVMVSSPEGAISLNNVTANDSWYSYGAQIIGGTSVTLTGTNTFNNNGSTGLHIQDSGYIGLNNITAKDNWFHGISVINSSGDINLSNITATAHSDTSGDGAYLENMAGSGNVTLTGTNDFSNHSLWNSGMYILSNGNVSLSGITSNNNGRGVNVSHATDVTITNATFSENIEDYVGTGAFVFASGNVSLNQITSNRSSLYIDTPGNVTLDNVKISDSTDKGLSILRAREIALKGVDTGGNSVGAKIENVGNVKITGGAFTSNGIGLHVICAESVTLNLPLATFTLNLTDVVIDPTCPIDITKEELPIITVVETLVEGEEFVLDCAMAKNRFVVHLANGDRGDITCPVVGNATITRVDNTTLPANLPAGYTYASGFEFKIERDGEEVMVISEGGYVTASFIASSDQLQPGNSYSILYWDRESSSWIPLKDYLLNEYKRTQVFDLFPGVEDDIRKILIGVRYFTEAGEERGEVTTNFPGIFVLAQH